GAPDEPEYAPARLGDVARSALDAARAAEILGWSPAVPIREGVSRTVDYFRPDDAARPRRSPPQRVVVVRGGSHVGVARLVLGPHGVLQRDSPRQARVPQFLLAEPH